MTLRIMTFAFYLLFFFTPLAWAPINYELFEYNKMIIVYLLTIIIGGVWAFRMVREQKLLIKRTPLDIPLLLFLGANILSTIFSIDPHTSWWGYYSRSNGGLLSLVSYLLLYFALVSNFDFKQALKFLKAAFLGGLLVSLWAIPEHFGASPSCALLTGHFNANCWVQDVQARVFATLGQPNWLAAYLEMLIFPAIYFFLTSKTMRQKALYFILIAFFYLAFTFTYSRGAMLGLLGGLGVFGVLMSSSSLTGGSRFPIRSGTTILGVFLLINLLFGSALTDFKLLSKFAPPPRPPLQLPGGGTTSTPGVTQLENGGTESGQIRLIVWKGAIEIFKHYPLFGSGVETFAYSYYNFRPVAHNLVSEWDFLYNKAHNEFLNYLATTGAVGFLSYLGIILIFIYWSVKKVFQKKLNSNSLILIASILASYISYLIQNFFGFSVVIIALFFYILPGFSFLAADSIYELKISKKLLFLQKFINATVYRRAGYKKIVLGGIFVITIYLGISVVRLWSADTLFAKGNNYSDAGNPGRAYNELLDAVSLNPGEPFYRSELGFAATSAAVSLSTENSTESAALSAKLKNLGLSQTYLALKISPRNVSFWRTAVRTFYELSSIDPDYSQKTIDVLNNTIKLAPTDPKLYYNKALILAQMERYDEATSTLQNAIKLKPNYRDAHFSLGVFYQTLAKKDKDNQAMWKQKALEEENLVLKLIPNDPDALKMIQEINSSS